MFLTYYSIDVMIQLEEAKNRARDLTIKHVGLLLLPLFYIHETEKKHIGCENFSFLIGKLKKKKRIIFFQLISSPSDVKVAKGKIMFEKNDPLVNM